MSLAVTYNNISIIYQNIEDFQKALEYQNDYIVALVLNMNDLPNFLTIENPIKNLKFEERIINSRIIKEYHLIGEIC